MAGDWLKMELEISDKPEVHYIANALNLDPDAVVGKLIRVWAWFNKHTTDGNGVGVTYLLLDRITSVTGFGEMMCLAGWLEQRDKVLHMPNFDRHNGESAKKRALTAKRVSKLRNAPSVTQALPEKRREESTYSTQNFGRFWKAYPRKLAKGDAEKAWNALKPDDTLAEQILKAVAAAQKSEDWRKDGGKFIPYPATWLRAKRWLDESGAPTVRFAEGCEGLAL